MYGDVFHFLFNLALSDGQLRRYPSFRTRTCIACRKIRTYVNNAHTLDPRNWSPRIRQSTYSNFQNRPTSLPPAPATTKNYDERFLLHVVDGTRKDDRPVHNSKSDAEWTSRDCDTDGTREQSVSEMLGFRCEKNNKKYESNFVKVQKNDEKLENYMSMMYSASDKWWSGNVSTVWRQGVRRINSPTIYVDNIRRRSYLLLQKYNYKYPYE